MAAINRIQSSNSPLLLPEVPALDTLLPGPVIKPGQMRVVDTTMKAWWTQVQLALRTALDTFTATVSLKSLRLSIAVKDSFHRQIFDDDFTCLCASSTALELELPPAGESIRRLLYFKRIDSTGLVTVVGNRGQKVPELVDGQLSLVVTDVTLLHCDGKAWYSI